MRKFWNMGGRRIAALFMAVLVLFMAVPCSNWGAIWVSADETGETTTYAITVKAVNVDGDTADSSMGTVTLLDSDGNNIDNEADGSFSIEEEKQVTITAAPEEGYKVSRLIVKKGEDEAEDVTDDGDDSTTDSFEYTINSIDANYVITAVFVEVQTVATTYTVTVSQAENGTISLKDGELNDNKIEVTEGEDVTFVFTPGVGYQVTGIFVAATALDEENNSGDGAGDSDGDDGSGEEGNPGGEDNPNDTEVQFSDEGLTLNTDGSYKYTISDISEGKTVSVVFDEIPEEEKDKNTDAMAQVGTLSDKEGNEIAITDDVTAYYASEMTLTASENNLIRLEDSGEYKESISVTNDTSLEYVYVREKAPTDFGTERKIVFAEPISLIIDITNPVITIEEDSKNIVIGPKNTAVEIQIKGQVADANLEKVICSETQLAEDKIATAGANVTLDEDAKFTYTTTVAANDIEKTYYFYAVDKAAGCSEGVSVTVTRDVTAPVITNVTINPALNSFAHGNYYNNKVTLTITANDVSDDCIVTGIQKIKLYLGNAAEAFAEMEVPEDASISNGDSYDFTVELPHDQAEFSSQAELKISAVDNIGNESERRVVFAEPDYSSSMLMIETHNPVITRETKAGYEKKDENDEIVSVWFKELPDKLTFKLSDKEEGKNGSGILSGNVSVDGTELGNYKIDETDELSAVQEKSIALLKTDLSTLEKGEHTFSFIAKDFAGNETEEEFVVGIDNGAPIVVDAAFSEVETTATLLNLVGFQNYYNSNIQIVVTVADTAEDGSENTAVSCAGAKSVTLYLNSTKHSTVEVDENGQATFIIPTNDQNPLEENKFFKYTSITVTTADNLGNTSNQTIIAEEENGSLIIETKKPKIESVTIDENGEAGEKTASSAVFYCNKEENGKPNIDFVVKASDADKNSNSGLKDIRVILNNEVAYEQIYADGIELFTAYVPVTSKIDLKNSNLTSADVYKGEIIVTDEAGNEAIFEITIYVDTTEPELGTPEVAAPGGEVSAITTKYYNGNVVVKVNPTDSGVGIKHIEWGTVGEDGSHTKVEEVAPGKDGKVTITIKPSVEAAYSEKIYIKAVDKLGNEGAVTELGNIVIETQAQHNGREEKHITVENKTAANYKDASGNPLYTGANAGIVKINTTIVDTFNGISSIEWTVQSEKGVHPALGGKVVVNGTELEINGKAEESSEGEENTNTWTVAESADFVSKITGEFEVDASAIEANQVTVAVTMTDLSGNKSTGNIVFGVDKTAPKITITFDDTAADATYNNVYKDTRTATITVVDRNFGENQLALEITNTDGSVPQATNWTTTVNPENPNQTTSVATVVFSEEGDYTLSVGGKDLAGQNAETVSAEEFTIDKTVPTIAVTYSNNNTRNGNYYAETQTAVIEIKEHNFVEERIEVTGTATADGAAITFPSIGIWSGSGDTYTTTITFEADALYQFNVDYTDKAGNKAEQLVGEEFYVDKTAPVIEITGVENGVPNAGDVRPIISISDANYDYNAGSVNITLIGRNNGEISELDGGYSTQAQGQVFTFNNFPVEQTRDDIYTLTATATDLAGNVTDPVSVIFSVNRFGSVYVLDEELKEITGKYVQKEIDVKLIEVNVDGLNLDTVKIVVDANGKLTDLQRDRDYTVVESGGNGSWYQYDYTVNKELFAGDGRYIVTLYSMDKAENVNENVDESKKAEISFGIDKTPPVIIPIDIASEEQYAEDIKTATVTVNDNLVLSDVQVFVGEEQSEYTAEGENYVFDIPSSSTRQDITIAAVDAAGNRTNYVINGVLVTTNAFIRWYNNTPLFVGSIVGVAAVSGAGVGGLVLRRRRRFKLK